MSTDVEDKAGFTRREVLKAAGVAAGAAAVTTTLADSLSPKAAAASSHGNVIFVDGFARPSGQPPAGLTLQQKRFTAVAALGGEGFGVDSDDAYHGPNDDVSDFSASEYTIDSAEVSNGTLTLKGKVVRAVDPASVGQAVEISGPMSPPGFGVAEAPTAILVDLNYSIGGTAFTGGGVILM